MSPKKQRKPILAPVSVTNDDLKVVTGQEHNQDPERSVPLCHDSTLTARLHLLTLFIHATHSNLQDFKCAAHNWLHVH